MIVIDLLTQYQIELASRVALRAAQRDSAVPGAVLQYRTPGLLQQLARAMNGSDLEIGRLGQAAARHGHEFMRSDCTIAQLIHAYGDISHALTELAHELHVSLPADETVRFQTLLEDSVACAATEYERQRAASTTNHRAARWRAFEAELRQLVHVALLSFDSARLSSAFALSPGSEAVGRSIRSLSALLERSPDATPALQESL